MTEDDNQPPWTLTGPPVGPEGSATPLPSSVPALAEPPVGPTPLPLRRGHPYRRWVVWSVVSVVVVALLVASRWNLNMYAIQPGTAQSVQQFITVPADKSHPVHHPVLLTDVEIGRVTALTYLYFKLQGDTAFDQLNSVTGGTAPSELNAQGNLEMSQAEAAAKTAALSRLGYPVTATAAGAVIAGTFAGTPAYQTLNVGDVITGVGGTAVTSAEELTTQLTKYHSGQTVSLAVRKGGTAAPAPVSVTLKSTVVNLGYATNGKGPYVRVDLGIEPEDQVDYTYPFPVSINVANIGGPSAGLAMTLGVIDALTSGSVTGGKTVAATGTIDAAGDVGDVGGVAQKTVAVEKAGATIFLVPPQEYGAAMSEDRPGLKVYAVSTLDQALQILAAHGGTVPPAPPASTTTSSAAG